MLFRVLALSPVARPEAIEPSAYVRAIPFAIISTLLVLVIVYGQRALRQFRKTSKLQRSLKRIVNTRDSVGRYLAITHDYLPKPVASMKAGLQRLIDAGFLSPMDAGPMVAQVQDLERFVEKMMVANQVSTAQAARMDMQVPSPPSRLHFSLGVWLPIALVGIMLGVANVVLTQRSLLTKSPSRMLIEFMVWFLVSGLVAFAYHYRFHLEQVEQLTEVSMRQQIAVYEKRMSFLPEVASVIGQQHDLLGIAFEPLRTLNEAGPILDSYDKLGHIRRSLEAAHTFASLDDQAPLFDVSSFIHNVVVEYNQRQKSKQMIIDARINPGIVMRIQPEEIAQLLHSLMDNAAKFSNYGGKIQLLLFQRFNNIVLSVSDYGEGIAGDQLPALLDPFAHTDNVREAEQKGLSLGLYSDKIIVDKLGGTITIRSQEGAGTMVTITLPATREPLQIKTQQPKPSKSIPQTIQATTQQ